jgi:hypothetical protein
MSLEILRIVNGEEEGFRCEVLGCTNWADIHVKGAFDDDVDPSPGYICTLCYQRKYKKFFFFMSTKEKFSPKKEIHSTLKKIKPWKDKTFFGRHPRQFSGKRKIKDKK